MLPLKLTLENFYCHTKSEIDFTQFSSAVIVGKINGNDKLSNGAGKSTIFAAIKYALFNEVDTSSLDKVIKHDAEFCRVLFEFQSSLDQQTYRIVRYRGKKPGTDVRIFRAHGEDWEDLTQRTATETEKEILKLIKINYRTFSNSVLFSQGDLTGVAAMSPRERKMALKEALQLGIYSKYEATVKKKTGELEKEVEKHNTILLTLGNPSEDLKSLQANLNSFLPQKEAATQNLTRIEDEIKILNENIFGQQQILEGILQKNLEITDSHTKVGREYAELDQEIRKLKQKINEYKSQETQIIDTINHTDRAILSLQKIKYRDKGIVEREIEKIRNQLAEEHAEYKIFQRRLEKLNIPLSEDAICDHCRQPINQRAQEICKQEIAREIKEIENKIQAMKLRVPSYKTKEKDLLIELENLQNHLITNNSKKAELELAKGNLTNLKNLIIEFQQLQINKSDQLLEKESVLTKLGEEEKLNSNTKLIIEMQSKIQDLKTEASNLLLQRKIYNEQNTSLSNQEAIMHHRIEERRKDQEKLHLLKSKISKLEHQYILHQKVLTAFGSNGIPALITHTILTDYQLEANTLLAQLRPGLQIQFSVENEKANGDLADTLEIIYLLNNNHLEFSQLSGAQKLIVSLSLKLGLASIISKRLGVDLQLLLIDEADAALDQYSLEAFEMAIKELQKDYKVLVITHNQTLREKFNYAIVVEQDSHLNSVARVMDGGW
jgi:DNA repair exonuclease SbcCD ATPase subunit